MVDNSELEYLRTFLGAAHSDATAKHKYEVGKMALINDTQKIMIEPGELLGLEKEDWYSKRYLVKLSEASEENLMVSLANIIAGIGKLNRRETITDYTRPSTLCHISIPYGQSTKKNNKSGRWSMALYIDVEWSIN